MRGRCRPCPLHVMGKWSHSRSARYEYDPYGNVIGPDPDEDGDWQEHATAYALANPIRFSQVGQVARPAIFGAGFCVFRVFRGSIVLGNRGIREPREKPACRNGHAAGWSPSSRPSPWEGEGADKLVGEPAEYRGTAHPTSPGTGRGWGGSIRFAARRLKSVTLIPSFSLRGRGGPGDADRQTATTCFASRWK